MVMGGLSPFLCKQLTPYCLEGESTNVDTSEVSRHWILDNTMGGWSPTLTTEEPLSLARFTYFVLLKSDPGILSMGPPVFLFERTSKVGSGGTWDGKWRSKFESRSVGLTSTCSVYNFYVYK